MKKTNQTTLALIAIVLLANACKTVTKSHTADYDFMYISKNGILQKPLITDLEVAKQRTTITKSYTNVNLLEAKENAMSDFIKQEACDLIVQPYFITSTITENEKTTISVTLTGYAAQYKNIRNFELKDTSSFPPRGFHTISNGTANRLAPAATSEILFKKKN